MRTTRTVCARPGVIQQLLRERGLDESDLAVRARINRRTVGRALSGGPVYLTTLNSIAHVLGVSLQHIVQESCLPAVSSDSSSDSYFKSTLSIEGHGYTGQPLELVAALRRFSMALTSMGSSRSVMCLTIELEQLSHVIALCAFVDRGRVYRWVCIAIETPQISSFVDTVTAKTSTLQQLSAFGELIDDGFDEFSPEDLAESLDARLARQPPTLEQP